MVPMAPRAAPANPPLTDPAVGLGATYGGAMYGGATYGGATYGGATYGGATYGTPTTNVPPPPPPGDTAYDACTAAADCTVLFVGADCVPSDPRALNRGRVRDYQRTHQRRPPACDIGGPEYEQRVQDIEARWGATCAAHRCALVDHGERQDPRRLP
jgi:hypothetical protein